MQVGRLEVSSRVHFPNVVFASLPSRANEAMRFPLMSFPIVRSHRMKPPSSSEEWPGLVRSIVSSTESHQIQLTFLGNLYVYGRATLPITESHPMEPCSEKGTARLEGTKILDQARLDGHDVVVCRAANYLGQGAETTVMPWSSLEKVVRGRKCSFVWFGKPDNRHSFALPCDIARGLAETCLKPDLRSMPSLHMTAIVAFSASDLSRELSSAVGRTVKPATVGKTCSHGGW